MGNRVAMVFCILMAAMTSVSAYAADEKLGRDDFISTSVASVFDKLGEYTSGEKKIVERDVWTTGEGSGAAKGSLGQAVSDPNITIRGNIPSDNKAPAEKKAP